MIMVKLPLSSLVVASYIATLCDKKRFDRNNTKIQKLLYCCYGCTLAAFNERLCDEHPCAWRYGPVFPSVFRHIRKDFLFPINACECGISEVMKPFLEKVIDAFGQYSASRLTAWSHKPNSPWDIVINEMHSPNGIIPDDLIRKYFSDEKIVVMDEKNA